MAPYYDLFLSVLTKKVGYFGRILEARISESKLTPEDLASLAKKISWLSTVQVLGGPGDLVSRL